MGQRIMPDLPSIQICCDTCTAHRNGFCYAGITIVKITEKEYVKQYGSQTYCSSWRSKDLFVATEIRGFEKEVERCAKIAKEKYGI